MIKKKSKKILEDSPKERIMDVALRLFYKQGYNNTGINQILEESKTFKLSFYNYFTSKENLGIEYIHRREIDFLNYTKRIMKNHPEYERYIEVWITMLRREIIRKKYMGCPFVNITLQTFGKEDIFKPHIKNMIMKWKKLVAAYLVKNEKISPLVAMKKAALILQIFEGSVQLYIATGNIDYINDLEDNLVSIL